MTTTTKPKTNTMMKSDKLDSTPDSTTDSPPRSKLKTTTERRVFSKLAATEKAEFVEEIVQWALEVWHSNADDLRSYWLETKSYETIIYTLRTMDGRMVGNSTLKLYKVNYDGTDVVVVKLSLGVDAKFRGNKFALRCLMAEMLRWKAIHPIQPLYLFSTLIHPVTYKLCCDLLNEDLYPHFKTPVNPGMQKMVEFLADTFGVEKAATPDPIVYVERFGARETQQAIDYWRTNQRPEVRFYIEHCPNYGASGDCLIGLGQVRLTHILGRMLRTLARNRLDHVRGRKHTFT